jgi:hypothetical protein
MVADLRGLVTRGGVEDGVMAELGGGLGGEQDLVVESTNGLAKEGAPRESLLKRLVARSACPSFANADGGWLILLAMVALARLAWAATCGSLSGSSSSNTGAVPNLRNGNVLPVCGLFVGDWARK